MPVSRFYICCKSLKLSSGIYLQRLFSTFADGWPGGGLLLQRLLAGGALLYFGAMNLGAAPTHFELAVPQIVGAACGILILAGLWTPLAGTVAAAVEVWIALSHPKDMWTSIVLAVLGASLAMIGPGAWSVDARLFGRKQIGEDL
jgi:putative oxidoreductase